VEYQNSDEGLNPEELLRHAKRVDGILSQLTDRLSGPVIRQLEAVKVISNVAVGFDNIDIAAATERLIAVTNTPDVLTETTADYAWALLMAVARRVVEGDRFARSGQWKCWTIDLFAGHDIYGKTLGIFGLGRIGQAVARRAQGFGMRVLYHDAHRAPANVEAALQAQFVGKDELLGAADFVSIHVPLRESTRKLIGAAELRRMKRNSILVNTARGPIVDEAALAEALRDGEIAGAGLDVFENEPHPHPALLELSNVVVTPHIASASIETRRRMSILAAENCAAALEGRRPANLVNPEAWERLGVALHA
jgi:lactate dehydrogenase-like 2-hydroxyacid dehydrogenase